MSYQVLARKWRPRFFREMVGQEHVLQALINALDHDRLHHAYLFTGTRGVGKTSIARILAKCLNCETGVSSEPCGQCSSCEEISNGSFIDLIEIDAASRTKVEEMRDLLDNVQYAPSKGRFKVYLIDEVHMLSTHSFNALLKTLEEPPEHVKFLLATTDPQKLPATILSRCLQFHLKNMVPEHIVNHLATILGKELIEFEEPALWALARSAEGSMRDALSLTDQAVSFGSGKVLESEVRAMLGSIDQQTVYQLAKALVNHDPQVLLEVISQCSEQSPDYAGVLDELLLFLHRMTIAQLVPDAIDNSLGDKQQLLELCQAVTAEELQLFYQMGLLGKRDIHLAPDLRTGLEMAVIRMLAFRPQTMQEPPVKKPLTHAAAEPEAIQEQQLQRDSESPVEATGQEAEDCLKKPEALESAGIKKPVEVQAVIEPTASNPENCSQEDTNHSNMSAQYLPDESLEEPEPAPDNNSNPPKQIPPANNDTRQAVKKTVNPETQSSVQQEPKKKTVLSIEDFVNNDVWKARFYDLPFSGLLRSVAAECVLLSVQPNTFNLAVNTDRAQLYNDTHADQIASVLSDIFAVKINVKMHTDTQGLQTPAEYLEEKNLAIYNAALRQLENDPGMQDILSSYSGRILKKTVKATDPSIIDLKSGL